MNKTAKGVIIGILGTLIVLFVIIVVSPSLMEMQRIADREASVKPWRDAGYDLVVDKHGVTCPTKQYQMWDNSCNFDIPLEKIPSSVPSTSTMEWLKENESFNAQLQNNPTKENCELARANINAIQETVNLLPSGDANSEIYLQGIAMYQESIQNYCQ